MNESDATPRDGDEQPQTDGGLAAAPGQQVHPAPQWDTDWRNVVRRREQGVDAVSAYTIKKRKSRYVARERDVDRQRAANLLKYCGVEVPDEVVL